MAIGLVGFVGVNSDNLGCESSGHKWIYYSTGGNAFVTLQIVLVLVHCAICVNTLYRIPKSFNMFESQKFNGNKDEESEIEVSAAAAANKKA